MDNSFSRSPRLLILQSWISFRGAEHISVEIAAFCQSHGWDVRLGTAFVDWDRLPPRGDDIQYVLPPKIIQWLCQTGRLGYLFFGPLAMLYLAISWGRWADIINPHNPPCELAAALAGKVWGKPTVWVCNGLPPDVPLNEAQSISEWLTWKLANLGTWQWAGRRQTQIISASEKVAKEIVNSLNRISTPLYQAIDFELFSSGIRSDGRQKLGLPIEYPIILTAGLLHRRKQMDLAIKCMPEVLQSYPEARLVIIGTGPSEKELELLSHNLGLENHILFLGYLPRAKMADFYAASDVCVIPYWRDEGCPAVPFEALAAGALPIVPLGGGADELLAKWNAGLIWDPKQSLATSLIHAIEVAKSTVGKMKVVRGQQMLSSELNWPKYTERVESIFRKTLEEGRN